LNQIRCGQSLKAEPQTPELINGIDLFRAACSDLDLDIETQLDRIPDSAVTQTKFYDGLSACGNEVLLITVTGCTLALQPVADDIPEYQRSIEDNS
jgi:hypothetical protein